MNDSDVTQGVLLLGVAAGMFGTFVPPWHDISNFPVDSRDANVRRTRLGTVAAATIVVATGALIAKATGRDHVLWLGLGVSFLFALAIEYQIAHPT